MWKTVSELFDRTKGPIDESRRVGLTHAEITANKARLFREIGDVVAMFLH